MYKNYFTSNFYHESNKPCITTHVSWLYGIMDIHAMCFTGNQKANPQEELYSFLVLCFNTFVELFWSKENHPVWLINNKLPPFQQTFVSVCFEKLPVGFACNIYYLLIVILFVAQNLGVRTGIVTCNTYYE